MNFVVVNSIWDGLARSTTSDGIYKTHEGNAVGACDDVDIWEMTHLLDFCNWPCDNMNYTAGRTVRVLDKYFVLSANVAPHTLHNCTCT